MQAAGKLLIIAGGLIAGVGVLLLVSDKIPFFGKLPGDITIKRESFQIFFPITSGIVLSLLISVVLWAILHMRGK